jgi:hypothetical protein
LLFFARTPLEIPFALVLVLVDRLMDKISVKAVIASFNLLLVFREGFAAYDGFFKASVNRIPAIGSILSHEKGVFFYRGVSPSKIGLIAPY